MAEFWETLQRLNAKAKFVRLELLSLSLLGHNFHFLLCTMQEVKKSQLPRLAQSCETATLQMKRGKITKRSHFRRILVTPFFSSCIFFYITSDG